MQYKAFIFGTVYLDSIPARFRSFHDRVVPRSWKQASTVVPNEASATPIRRGAWKVNACIVTDKDFQLPFISESTHAQELIASVVVPPTVWKFPCRRRPLWIGQECLSERQRWWNLDPIGKVGVIPIRFELHTLRATGHCKNYETIPIARGSQND